MVDRDAAGQDRAPVNGRTVWTCPLCLSEINEDGATEEARYCRHGGLWMLMVRLSVEAGYPGEGIGWTDASF